MTLGEWWQHHHHTGCQCHTCRPWLYQHTWPTTTASSTISYHRRESFKTWRKAMKFAAKVDRVGKAHVSREDGRWVVRWTPRGYWTTTNVGDFA